MTGTGTAWTFRFRPSGAVDVLAAGTLLVMMLGGTLPVPLYVLYQKHMGFGSLGITVVFAAYATNTYESKRVQKKAIRSSRVVPNIAACAVWPSARKRSAAPR